LTEVKDGESPRFNPDADFSAIHRGELVVTNTRKPAVPTVQIETERAIVTEWRFEPGAETTWHRHEYDYIVVPQTTGKLSIETVSGKTISELVAGVSYARSKGVEHNEINQNNYEFVFVEIELK